MIQYTEAFKRAMVQKMLDPPGRSANSLSQEVGVSKSALAKWRYLAVTMGSMKNNRETNHKTLKQNQRSAEEKLRILTQAGALSEEELGEYLRKEGVYEAHLSQWRTELKTGLSSDESLKELRRQLKMEREKTKRLERELQRKEKALAEAAALLVLKKKAEDYFGVVEDKNTPWKKS
jgi:transposase